MADHLVGLTPGGDVVVQQAAPASSGPATQIGGGGSGGFSGFVSPGRATGGNYQQVADQNAKSLDALDKLTQGLLKPHIEQAQKEAYFDGMAQVAQGRSLLEVKQDQPWYTKLFGDSATVQGAQAMTMMGAMNQQKSDFMEAMPQLRTQTPDAVRQYLVQNASKLATTGDPFMDAMIQGKLAENFQPMLDLHVKQHVAYVQEQNNTAYGNVLISMAKGYQDQQGADWGMLTPEQRDVQTKQVQAAFTKMPGQTDDSWNKVTGQAVQTMLMSGNFAMVQALKDSEHWNSLTPQMRETITKLEPYAVNWNQKNNPMYRDSVLQDTSLQIAVSNGAAGSWESVKASMDAKNDQYQKAQGSTVPYYDNADYANMQKLWAAGQHRLDAARGKAQAEVSDAAAQRTYIMEAVNSGSYNPIAQNNLDPDIVQRTLLDARKDIESNPQQPGGMGVWLKKLAVASEQRVIDNDLSHRMTVDTNNLFQQGGVVTDAQRQTIDYARMFASAPNGAAALAKYVGDENAAKMLFLIKSGADLGDKSTMDALRKVANEGWATKPIKSDIDEVTNYLDKQDPGFLKRHIPVYGPGALSGYDLNDDSKRNMIQQLAPQIAAYRRGLNLSMEEAVGLAFQHRYGASSNTDFVDGTFVEPGFLPKGQGLFATVAGRVGGMSQVSEDYQLATKRAIANSMTSVIAKGNLPDGWSTMGGGVDNVAGMLSPGNLDITTRPRVKNSDGSISTVRSMTATFDDGTYLLPTVIGDKVVSNKEAVEHFKRTGENLGKFKDVKSADAYGESLHKQQESMYVPKELTQTDKAANTAAKFVNDTISAIPFVGEAGRVFNETGALRPEPNTFNPDDWKTISGLQVGGGVLALTRVQKAANGNQRPVTVYITPDAVLKEYDAIRKAGAKVVPATPPAAFGGT